MRLYYPFQQIYKMLKTSKILYSIVYRVINASKYTELKYLDHLNSATIFNIGNGPDL